MTIEDRLVSHRDWKGGEPVDLADASTKGCLLAQLRRVFGCEDIYTRPSSGGWVVWLSGERIGRARSEGAALAEAFVDDSNRPQKEKVAGAFTGMLKVPGF